MRRRIIERRNPCGRTGNEVHLSCMREHKWYNTFWVSVFKIKGGKVYHYWKRKCLVCGHTLQIRFR